VHPVAPLYLATSYKHQLINIDTLDS
jgi:hypothetical protein